MTKWIKLTFDWSCDLTAEFPEGAAHKATLRSSHQQSAMTRQIHFGLFMQGTGNHVAGWRMPGAHDSHQSMDVCLSLARTAERGKFDMLFSGDGYGLKPGTPPSGAARLQPILMFSAIAMATTHVGLGATASTTYNDPYTVARAFATLDHISKGRAAWNAVTTAQSGAGAVFGRQHPKHEERYEVATEFISVVKQLWDCWEDDAILADRETGQFIDWNKVHLLTHKGKFFDIEGAVNIGRSPQGHPVVLQAGGSESGQELAAATADVVFSVVQDFDEARIAYTSLKDRVARRGRDPDSVCAMPGVMTIVGETDAKAREQLSTLQSFVDESVSLVMLKNRLGINVTPADLDKPVPPDLALPDASHGFARTLISKARRENMMMRDLYNLVAAARGHWVLCGSPKTIADTFEKWFLEGAADGFNVMPPYFPGAFDDFVDMVVPELQRRGLYRRDYTGTTLRDHLGLPRPEGRRT
jgi:FMN-dependent oxidoreductase (nitrilotriacetate monooxygenase family)